MRHLKKYLLGSQSGFVLLFFPIIIVILVGGTYLAFKKSSESVPGEILYFIKELGESFKLSSSINVDEKAQAYLQISEDKLKEIEKMVVNGNKVENILVAVTKMEENRDKAVENIEILNTRREKIDELSTKMIISLEHEQQVLTEVSKKVPDEAKLVIEMVIKRAKEAVIRIRVLLQINKSGGQKQLFTPSITGSSYKTPTPTTESGYQNVPQVNEVTSVPTKNPTLVPTETSVNGKPKPTKIPTSG